VEIAESIDPALRRYGSGRRFVARALGLAFARGTQSAEFVFAPNNHVLAGLVQDLGDWIEAPRHAWIDRSASGFERNSASGPMLPAVTNVTQFPESEILL
jgi:ribosomal protein S18 acetylase RimI-like enzyme